MRKRIIVFLGALCVVLGALISPSLTLPVHADVSLTGAGSTFDFPFFDAAFKGYGHGVTVNYQPVGSGAGIQQFTQKLVDFGASDVPMNPITELPAAVKAGGPVAQIPVALGGISIAYNIPGVKTGLKLDGPTIAKIFLGTITRWNDPTIRKLNKGVKLPALAITTVHRSDGSGTSYAFTDYLAKVNDQWRGLVGVSKTPTWPTNGSVGGKGNLGVAQLVESTPGAVGYVELAYVLQTHMNEAAVENRSKRFEVPTLKSVAAAAAAFPKVSSENFSITNEKGKDVYPIVTYSWLLVFKNQPDAAKGKALVTLMKWLATSAQTKYAKSLDYVPLPKNVQTLALNLLKQVH